MIEVPVVEAVSGVFRSTADAIRNAADAIGDGVGTAAAIVQSAIPKKRNFISRAVYSAFYHGSYCVVFPTVFMAGVVPGMGPVKDGLIDGAVAATLHALRKTRKVAR
jgi:hypothetical protein